MASSPIDRAIPSHGPVSILDQHHQNVATCIGHSLDGSVFFSKDASHNGAVVVSDCRTHLEQLIKYKTIIKNLEDKGIAIPKEYKEQLKYHEDVINSSYPVNYGCNIDLNGSKSSAELKAMTGERNYLSDSKFDEVIHKINPTPAIDPKLHTPVFLNNIPPVIIRGPPIHITSPVSPLPASLTLPLPSPITATTASLPLMSSPPPSSAPISSAPLSPPPFIISATPAADPNVPSIKLLDSKGKFIGYMLGDGGALVASKHVVPISSLPTLPALLSRDPLEGEDIEAPRTVRFSISEEQISPLIIAEGDKDGEPEMPRHSEMATTIPRESLFDAFLSPFFSFFGGGEPKNDAGEINLSDQQEDALKEADEGRDSEQIREGIVAEDREVSPDASSLHESLTEENEPMRRDLAYKNQGILQSLFKNTKKKTASDSGKEQSSGEDQSLVCNASESPNGSLVNLLPPSEGSEYLLSSAAGEVNDNINFSNPRKSHDTLPSELLSLAPIEQRNEKEERKPEIGERPTSGYLLYFEKTPSQSHRSHELNNSGRPSVAGSHNVAAPSFDENQQHSFDIRSNYTNPFPIQHVLEQGGVKEAVHLPNPSPPLSSLHGGATSSVQAVLSSSGQRALSSSGNGAFSLSEQGAFSASSHGVAEGKEVPEERREEIKSMNSSQVSQHGSVSQQIYQMSHGQSFEQSSQQGHRREQSYLSSPPLTQSQLAHSHVTQYALEKDVNRPLTASVVSSIGKKSNSPTTFSGPSVYSPIAIQLAHPENVVIESCHDSGWTADKSASQHSLQTLPPNPASIMLYKTANGAMHQSSHSSFPHAQSLQASTSRVAPSVAPVVTSTPAALKERVLIESCLSSSIASRPQTVAPPENLQTRLSLYHPTGENRSEEVARTEVKRGELRSMEERKNSVSSSSSSILIDNNTAPNTIHKLKDPVDRFIASFVQTFPNAGIEIRRKQMSVYEINGQAVHLSWYGNQPRVSSNGTSVPFSVYVRNALTAGESEHLEALIDGTAQFARTGSLGSSTSSLVPFIDIRERERGEKGSERRELLGTERRDEAFYPEREIGLKYSDISIHTWGSRDQRMMESNHSLNHSFDHRQGDYGPLALARPFREMVNRNNSRPDNVLRRSAEQRGRETRKGDREIEERRKEVQIVSRSETSSIPVIKAQKNASSPKKTTRGRSVSKKGSSPPKSRPSTRDQSAVRGKEKRGGARERSKSKQRGSKREPSTTAAVDRSPSALKAAKGPRSYSPMKKKTPHASRSRSPSNRKKEDKRDKSVSKKTTRPNSPTKRPSSPAKKLSKTPTGTVKKSQRPVSPASKLGRPSSPTKKIEKGSSPIKRGSSPSKRGSSPAKRGSSPAKRGSSPAKRGSSPLKKTGSPSKRGVTPSKRASSPSKRGVTPVKRASSPSKRSSSPVKRGVTPSKKGDRGKSPIKKKEEKERGVTPKKKAPRSPSPHNKVSIMTPIIQKVYIKVMDKDTQVYDGAPINVFNRLSSQPLDCELQLY